MLILGSLAGSALSMGVLAGQIWRDDRVLLRKGLHLRGMMAGAKRYRKFPLVSTWSALMNTLSWQLPAFMLAGFFSTSVAGFYSLGFRVLAMPMSLVGGAIAQVFFQRAARVRSKED
jgi:O-antigen/teichoic acid export membrane protein